MPKFNDLVIKQSAPDSEISLKFIQGMANRMGVSYYKYGAVREGYPVALDAIASLKQRLDKYEETGNTEWLIDVANFAMIEFMFPGRVNAHFKGTDSDESPGRVTTSKQITFKSNKEQGV